MGREHGKRDVNLLVTPTMETSVCRDGGESDSSARPMTLVVLSLSLLR